MIEKYKNFFGYELYDSLSKVYREMHEKNLPITNHEYFTKTLNNVFKHVIEEQVGALKMLTRTIVDVVLPLPTRLAMWIAEQNIDKKNPAEMTKLMGSIISFEQAKIICDYERIRDPDGILDKMIDDKLKKSSKKVKENLKKFVCAQKEIITELITVGEFLNNNVLINSTPYVLEIMAKLSSQLARKQEIREYGIENLFDDLTLGKSEAVTSIHAE